MLTHTRSRALVVATLLVVLGATAAAMAQADAAEKPSAEQNWRDFIHYIRVARPDLAAAYGKALLEADVDPRVLYRESLKTEGAFQTLTRGETSEQLVEMIQTIRGLIEEGYRLESQDPERIANAIDLLGGHIRQYTIGADRLKSSGEYAVPQMIARLADPSAPTLLRDRIPEVLGRLGRSAVRPLNEALSSDNAMVREVVCRALGQSGYAHAAPYLKPRLDDPEELIRVKVAALAALEQVTLSEDPAEVPLANRFYELAMKYYNGDDSILPDRRFNVANVWYWREGVGLNLVEVPSAIFLDVYAMRSARRALLADQSFSPAVTLWLQANLRKESNLPAGATDPTRGPTQLDAAAYAKAAGAGYMQQVLARALAARETAVVKGAIQALSRTAGASNLAVTAGGATPLVSALSYPDRRVRLMAAASLANARPTEPFIGSETVIPALIESLRQTGRKNVLLIEPDTSTRNRYKGLIRQIGYEVTDADSFAAGLALLEKVTGVDMVVIGSRVQAPPVEEAMGLLRQHPVLALQPVVLVADDADMVTAKRVTRKDKMVVLLGSDGLDRAVLQAAMNSAVAASLGSQPMDPAEALKWVLSAARSIRLLGVSRTTVFDLSRTVPALVDGTADERDEVKVACARALAVVPGGKAQQAIVELAASAADEQVRIAAYLAAAESVRISGRQLLDEQAQAVVAVVKSTASDQIRDAASELLGALDLPSRQIKSLIVEGS